ncbi:MAG: DNA mismatch repair endonuclease MutL [Deltaproteobacteria bacterium]|nr:DNA mismatch repair endonuclease MutL [Deltaproteobacteria bacterium]
MTGAAARGRIRKLDPSVIALIAAGEVVERPASVVKELCENALDAGATSIEVAIAEGGRSRIAVIDDGCGMTPDELLLALERHATSKIESAADLERIRTLGFRGEALPAIAAVSRVSILTRRPEDPIGVRTRVEGGAVLEREQAGAAIGTRVVVEDLFFNTPARRKFLRSAATEAGRIHAALVDLALARPAVRFRLESNGRTLLDLPAAASSEEVQQRVGSALGRELFAALYPVAGDEAGIRLAGYFADPGRARRDTRGYHLFVNGRAIQSRSLMHAVRRSYRTLLEAGRHPVVVLQLGIDPSDVDVNVHPSKQEVRFRDDASVQDAIAHVLGQAVARTPWIGISDARAATGGARFYPLPTAADEVRDRPGEVEQWHRARVRDALERRAAALPPASTARHPVATPAVLEPASGAALLGTGFFGGLRVIGQLFETYLVCQGEDTLVLIDQHAAHERLTYERLLGRRRAGQPAAQRLLLPVQLEVEPRLLAAVDDNAGEIAALGFEIELFGGGTALVRAVPADLATAAVEPLVRDLLAELAEHGTQLAHDEAVQRVYARLACHGSVRAGRALGASEIEALLRDLDGIDFKGHCPHGRPVVTTLGRSEIERLFGRS